jgi:hypothetical protein
MGPTAPTDRGFPSVTSEIPPIKFSNLKCKESREDWVYSTPDALERETTLAY